MHKFRRTYYDLFSKFYDRFVALHATDKQGILREILCPAHVHGPEKSSSDPEARSGLPEAPFPACPEIRHHDRQIQN